MEASDCEPAQAYLREAGPRPKIVALGLVLMVVGAAVFARGLNAPFVFDDLSGIRDNPNARSLWPISRALGAPDETPAYGRPVVALSLALTYAVCGDRPWGYHLFSLAVHLVNGLLVFDLLRLTILSRAARQPMQPARAAVTAFVMALLWLIHPLQTEAVTYASQRTELLFCLFLLLTLWAFVRSGPGASRQRWSAVAVGACGLGMASKETMVVAPLLVFLYDRTFVSGSFGRAWRSHGMLHIGLMLTWVMLGALVMLFPRTGSAGFGHGGYTGLSAWTYLLTQSRAIAHYLHQAVWPDRLSIDIHLPIAQTVGDVLGFGLLVLALLALTLYGLVRRPVLGLLGAWFFGILAPTSSVVPIVTEIAAERRMYLPLLALVAAVVLVVNRAGSFITRSQAVGLGLAVAVVLSIASTVRLGAYATEVKLYEDAVAKFPDNGRALRNLGSWYILSGRHNDAIEQYRRALELEPRKLTAHHGLGVALSQSDRADQALCHFEIFRAAEPAHVVNLNDFGSAYGRLGRFDEAESLLREAIAVDPDYAVAYDNLARVYRDRGDPASAEKLWRRYLELESASAVSHNDLGVVLAQQGKIAAAAGQFRLALALDPNFDDARANLARSEERLGEATVP